MNNLNTEGTDCTLAFWTLSSLLQDLFPLFSCIIDYDARENDYDHFRMVIVIAYFPRSDCLSKIKIKCSFMPHLLLQLLFNCSSPLLSKMSCKRWCGLGFYLFTNAAQADWASKGHASMTNSGQHAVPDSHKHHTNPNENARKRMTTPFGLS